MDNGAKEKLPAQVFFDVMFKFDIYYVIINGFLYCTLVSIILFQLHAQLAVIVLKGIIAALDTARKVSSILPNKFFMQIHLK